MVLKNAQLPSDNTEKIWAHPFFAKPKTIAAGGLRGAVSLLGGPGWVRRMLKR